MKKILILLAATFVVAGFAGCGEAMTGISVEVPDVALAVGETSMVEVAKEFNKEMPEDKMNELIAAAGIAFASSDEAVVTVDNEAINAVAPGKADVTVTAGELNAVVHVTVIQQLVGIETSEAVTLPINIDPEGKVDVKVNPADADVTVAYESSNPAIVTVDGGKLTAMAEGEAVITTTVTGQGVEDGKIIEVVKTAKTTVRVCIAAESIRLEQETEGILYVGGAVKLAPRTVPAEAPASTYMFQSSDETVATVAEDGTVTANATGNATITVTSAEGLTTEYKLVVQAKPTAASSGNTSGSGGNRASTGNNMGSTGSSGNSGGGGTATPSTPVPEQPSTPVPVPDPTPTPMNPGVGEQPGDEQVPYDPSAPNVGGEEAGPPPS